MNNRDIEWRRKKLKRMSEGLESGQLNAVRELVSKDMIEDICNDSGYDFRHRIITPLVTIFHMISAGMSRDGSFQSAWHFNGQSGKSGTLAKARKRLPLEVWARLHEQIAEEIEKETEGKDRWLGHRMIGVDGTCVSMSDEAELADHFGRCKTSREGVSRFPFTRIGIALNLNTMVTVAHQVGRYATSEPGLLRQMIETFQRNDVLIFDRLYSGSNLYAECKEAGLEFIGRAHVSLQIERRIVEVLGPEDFILELRISKRSRRQNRSLPRSIHVRALKTAGKIRGKKQELWILTSLLDALKYPKKEICHWYKKRWKVEPLIGELKIWLGADVLRSKTAEGIYKEIYARVIGLNLIHWLILKAAKQYDRKPEEISVSATLRLTIAYSMKMSTAPIGQLLYLYEDLLMHIAASTIPFRPHRIEPRLQKREPRNYPKLKISRSEWRRLYAAA